MKGHSTRFLSGIGKHVSVFSEGDLNTALAVTRKQSCPEMLRTDIIFGSNLLRSLTSTYIQ